MLDGSARARVTETTPVGATVLLETGRAKVIVIHKARTEWKVTTGPYLIRVTGTSFAVSWEPAAGALEVVMFAGAVVVKGPGIESGVALSGSQRFVTSSAPKVDHTRAEPACDGRRGVGDVTERPGTAGASRGRTEDAINAHPSEDGTFGRGRCHFGGGANIDVVARKLDGARGEGAASAPVLEEAERRGIDMSLDSASEADLSALADAARSPGESNWRGARS